MVRIRAFNRTSGAGPEAVTKPSRPLSRNSEHCQRFHAVGIGSDYAGAAGCSCAIWFTLNDRGTAHSWHSLLALCVRCDGCLRNLCWARCRIVSGRRSRMLVSSTGWPALCSTARHRCGDGAFPGCPLSGRIVAGITGATGAVAGAALPIITDGDDARGASRLP